MASKTGSDLSEQGPNVEAALAVTPAQPKEPRKATIGQRKPAKKGLGVKKGGLGAQKVKKDFAEIEREAEMADQVRSRMEEERKEAELKTAEDEAKAAASMRLAYQDLSQESKKKEEKLRVVDPKKAAQVERLGMGASAKSGGISHSALTGMATIEQEEPRNSRSSGARNKSRRNNYDDDADDFDSFGGFGGGREDKYDWRSSSRNNDEDNFGGSGSSNWEKEFEVLKVSNASSKKNEWNNNFDDDAPKRGSDYG